MKRKIFREYDIRGVVGEDFTISDVTQLGKAFASLVMEKVGSQIIIGRDGRLSSPSLAIAFQEGLVSCGATVTDIGVVPTPLLYFAAHQLKSHGAVMITGSHNPPEYNGFKIMVGGKPFCGQDIQHLYETFSSGIFKEEKGGSLEVVDWSDTYINFLLRDFKENYGNSSLKIGWYCGNGAAGNIVSQLLQSLPGTHYLINEEIDGNFPSHHPDPTEPKNMRQLCELVQKEGCDFGIGFDGDGDRIGVVDPKGRLVWGDQLMNVFAEEVLGTHPGAPILADVKSTKHLFKAIELFGGKPILCRTGHSQIKLRMKELGSPLAGEMSGHIMFADRAFGFDDALYAAIRLIGIFSKKSLSFEEWLDRQPQSFKTKELHIPSDHKFQQVEKLKDLLRKEGKAFSDIDGIRFEEESGWWLIRASNTQEILVVRAEADSQTYHDDLLSQVESYLLQVGVEVNLHSLAFDE
ncbi:MAG TPA: phosphomannomutase/phosphoglucomutase [Alphaproteobacteria bacterium]|nr:phosphomannomutase/phosphoglucomutase [Alphaproteobacteria bacterium]